MAHSYACLLDHLVFFTFLEHDNVSVTPLGFWLERLSWPRVPLALHPGLRVLRRPAAAKHVETPGVAEPPTGLCSSSPT